jgi:hypothetical protein
MSFLPTNRKNKPKILYNFSSLEQSKQQQQQNKAKSITALDFKVYKAIEIKIELLWHRLK